jgi:hypothetical protein
MRPDPPESVRFVSPQVVTIALLMTGYAGYYLCRSNLSVTLPLLTDHLVAHGMTPAEARIRLGTLASLGVFAYAIGKIVLGGTADFFGGRRTFLAGMCGAVTFTVVFSLAGGLPIFTLAWIGNRLVQSMGWAGVVKVETGSVQRPHTTTDLQAHGLCLQPHPGRRAGAWVTDLSPALAPACRRTLSGARGAAEPTTARSVAPEDGPELRLRALQDAALLGAHVLSGPVQIEGEHRHGRLVGRSLAPLARLGRALEGERDPARIALSEDAPLEIERIAPPRDLARPIAGTSSW